MWTRAQACLMPTGGCPAGTHMMPERSPGFARRPHAHYSDYPRSNSRLHSPPAAPARQSPPPITAEQLQPAAAMTSQLFKTFGKDKVSGHSQLKASVQRAIRGAPPPPPPSAACRLRAEAGPSHRPPVAAWGAEGWHCRLRMHRSASSQAPGDAASVSALRRSAHGGPLPLAALAECPLAGRCPEPPLASSHDACCCRLHATLRRTMSHLPHAACCLLTVLLLPTPAPPLDRWQARLRRTTRTWWRRGCWT